MSHLSRRDLSRMDEASELLSGGESRILCDENGQSQIAKISFLKKPQQSSDHEDYFFSQVTQAMNLKNALGGSSQDVVDTVDDEKSNALTAFYKQQVKLERQKH